jgi:peptidyl-prolyl cis-trans isomerase A (cyclophilin A)
MTRSVLAALLAVAIIAGVATGCGGSSSKLSPSSLHAKAPATFSAQFTTTKGPFVVNVTRSSAPKGADRFYDLVRNHFYDNQPIFRVLPGFIAQWGISGNPATAKAWQDATIKDDPVTQQNAQGTITFATSGPNTRTTQLFVNLGSNGSLDSMGFSPFGTITSGFSVFSHLYSGYGENASNNQAQITQYGASWVHKHFPKLDWITTARLVR